MANQGEVEMDSQKRIRELTLQVAALQAQLGQGQGQWQLTGPPVQVQEVRESQPVRVQHEVTLGASADSAPDRGDWTCFALGWCFCITVAFCPVSFFIWSTAACNHFCQQKEVQDKHPENGKVARASLFSMLGVVAVLLLLAFASAIVHSL